MISGENRESGLSPERSRHCKREFHTKPLSSLWVDGKGDANDERKPGDLPFRVSTPPSDERRSAN